MKQKMAAILVAFVMTISLAACDAGEETTLTGMVVSVDGTVISLMEMDTDNMGSKDFAGGERPEMPEGMEGFQGFGDFNPEDFEGTFPEGGNFPQWGDGEMPEMPEGMTPPEGMTLPEGVTMPENGEMPDFSGENGDMRPNFGNLEEDMETKDVDIADAHISLEIEGGKASGSLDDIKAGTFVTITINGKGKATNVLISSGSGFGGGRRPSN